MPRHGAAETPDVVLQQEAFHEAAPLLGENRRVPRHGDRDEHDERAPVEYRARPRPEVAPQPAIEERAGERHEDGDRSLRQHAEADRRVRRIEPCAPAGRQVLPGGEHRRGDEHVEERVRRRRATDDEDAERCREQRRGEGRACAAVVAPREKIGEPRPERRAQRRGQAKGPLARTDERHRRRLQPVDEDRLVVARLAVQVGRQEVAALEHLERRLAERAFVHIEERRRAEHPVEARDDGEHGEPARSPFAHGPRILRSLLTSPLQEATMFERLHHIAYRCRDAQRTVDFYTEVVGLKYVAGLMPPENTRLSWPLNEAGKPPRKVVDGASDSIHIFFELGDGSYLAFFDVASSPQEKEDPATPWWVKHIAFETDSMEKLVAAKARLEAHGVQVLGPKDHDFCQSIYFMDPDGHRLEITVRTEEPDTWRELAAAAPGELAKWDELKRRKYGHQPAPGGKIAAMPADSTVVPA